MPLQLPRPYRLQAFVRCCDKGWHLEPGYLINAVTDIPRSGCCAHDCWHISSIHNHVRLFLMFVMAMFELQLIADQSHGQSSMTSISVLQHVLMHALLCLFPTPYVCRRMP